MIDPFLYSKVNFRHPKNIQQEGLIREIQACQLSPLKQILFILGSLCTGGLLYLLTRWDLRAFLLLRAKKCNPQQASYFIIFGQDQTQTIIKPIRQNGTIMIEYRLYRYVFTDQFEPIETTYQQKTNKAILEDLTINRKEQIEAYGLNKTEIPDKGLFKTLIEEVLSPFYIFQICSVLLWFWANYIRYASVILFTSLLSIVVTLREQRQSFRRLQELSKYSIPVKIKIENEIKQISSEDLVPGDVMVIDDKMTMPCDAIMLNGQAIFNESVLTGESIPVLKTSLPKSDILYDPNDEGKQSTLFAGTTCLETKSPQKQTVYALVTQTAFNTMKGQLIRSIMFPVQNSFKFYSDSMKFVGIMALLAVVGFIATVPNKIEYLLDGSISTWEFINEGLDLITITVPPALPTCLQIGVSIALSRLQKHNIFCISPPKVNISGKVTIMCFDKTGTLTEEGLDLYGIRAVGYQQNNLKFTKLYHECNDLMRDNNLSFQQLMNKETKSTCGCTLIEIMASCHGLARIQGQIIGDPLEIKMFQSTGWILDEESNYLCTVSPQPRIIQSQNNLDQYQEHIDIIKRFEFSSKLQRMSVIVKKDDKLYAHLKGSPEKVREHCIPSSIPSNYHEILDFYAFNGFRVLAVGTKLIESDELDRQYVESDLYFIGFIIMENKLKPITQTVIKQLQQSNIKSIMVTGDNVLTAISVARQCGIIGQQRVYLGELSEKKLNGKYYVTWKNMEYSDQQLQRDSLLPEQNQQINQQQILNEELVNENEEINHRRSIMEDYTSLLNNKSLLEEPPPNQQEGLSNIYTDGDFFEEQPWNDNENYVMAISGGAFSLIYKYGSEATLNKILNKALVYARMRPDEKANLMVQLQKQRKNPLVGFCGDGANDCGALKSADVGVSLSSAEASIAAPFTSNIQDISCIPILLSQGRAALTTSFTCFKFMALYSMIQFIQVTILYLKQSNLTDNQYLYNDLFTIFPLSMTMGFTQASSLNKFVPGASLISFQVLGSVIGQTIIQLIFQLIVYFLLLQQSWFLSAEEINQGNINDESMKVCFENTTLFIFGNFQYIATAIAFSNGKPFRKSLYTNVWFLLSLIILFALGVIFMFWRNEYIDDIMGFKFIVYRDGKVLTEMPEIWVTYLAFFAILNSLITVSYDRIFIPLITRRKDKVEIMK